MKLRERLKLLRKKNKETQEMLAEKLGVSARTIGSWEQEDRVPSCETLICIADKYHVSVDYLLGRSDDPNVFQSNPPNETPIAKDFSIKKDMPPSKQAHAQTFIMESVSNDDVPILLDGAAVSEKLLEQIAQLAAEKALALMRKQHFN